MNSQSNFERFYASRCKIVNLEFSENLQGHMMLRDAALNNDGLDGVLRQSSGGYKLHYLSSALQSASKIKQLYSASRIINPGNRSEITSSLPPRQSPPGYSGKTHPKEPDASKYRERCELNQHTADLDSAENNNNTDGDDGTKK